jgi:bifunctional UDP-N-acetylglucosamine pyrophosphorylase/glucosamine-1-phosphate N-acetyltransferase
LGNFVELKNSKLGAKTKVAHLSYLGDATVGDRVNIGCGTITANYDGAKKHPTQIGDRSKTGANTVLVAPIALGQDVTVAAGSTITEDVPDDCLVVARSRQVVKPGWRLKRQKG